MRIDSRTFSVSFVAWLLENTTSLVITLTDILKELFNQYCDHFQVKPNDFKGVDLCDSQRLEKYYETRLFAIFYTLILFDMGGP